AEGRAARPRGRLAPSCTACGPLFDILDDGGRGYVHISEIESRWQGADTRDLPGGVLGCLRRVTPPHGCLTFERFVAGLRYSMLNPEHSSQLKAQAAVHPQQAPKLPHKPGAPASRLGVSGGSRRHGRSREEQRRHTISNGVDYGMLKQMKELEQEKDSLLAGLEVVERARDWYQGQIHNVTERQRQVGQSSHCAVSLDGAAPSQSRMNVLIPKLQEVNRCLNELIPAGMVRTLHSSSGPGPPQAIQRLKDQNRLLTQEVTERSERIAQLEQEKSALIKQLFEARARSAQDTSTLDSTFI
uniref:Suppressor APC domain containing 2 n=1 Tax=Salarias fasciatus TaxID=181472 RepID=A0A672IVS3_SALFA